MAPRPDRISERHPTPNCARGRQGHEPCLIVVHTTVGSWPGVIDWFGRAESGVASHYLVGLDGRVAEFVAEADTAFHAGRIEQPTARLVRASRSDPNLFSIGIEFEDGGHPHDVRRPPAQYSSGAALIAGAAARWGFPIDRDHVIGHREVTRAKECPGNLDVDRLVEAAQALLAPVDPLCRGE